MSAMLDGLLALSPLGCRPMERGFVDLSRLAEEIAKTLQDPPARVRTMVRDSGVGEISAGAAPEAGATL